MLLWGNNSLDGNESVPLRLLADTDDKSVYTTESRYRMNGAGSSSWYGQVNSLTLREDISGLGSESLH